MAAVLDWRKPHTVHGAGPGHDIVIQKHGDTDVLFDRGGKRLPKDLAVLEKMGFHVPTEVQVHLDMIKHRAAAAKQEREIQERLAEFERQIRAARERGESISDDEDVADPALAELDDIEALVAVAEATQQKGSRVR